MKIIYLNTLNGSLEQPITDFIKLRSEDTDIFCLQEVYGNMSNICYNILSEYNQISIGKINRDNKTNYSQSIYVKKNHKIISTQSIFGVEENIGLGQYAEVKVGNKIIHIINIHGVTGHIDNKLDTENRIIQSKGFIDYLANKEGIKIIGGDFNILRNTKSIQMFEDFNYRNLISDYNIKTTRNKIAWDRHETKMFDSDYVFINKDMEIDNFIVDDVLISDHLPMILEI